MHPIVPTWLISDLKLEKSGNELVSDDYKVDFFSVPHSSRQVVHHACKPVAY